MKTIGRLFFLSDIALQILTNWFLSLLLMCYCKFSLAELPPSEVTNKYVECIAAVSIAKANAIMNGSYSSMATIDKIQDGLHRHLLSFVSSKAEFDKLNQQSDFALNRYGYMGDSQQLNFAKEVIFTHNCAKLGLEP
jgi:hypothetical protein